MDSNAARMGERIRHEKREAACSDEGYRECLWEQSRQVAGRPVDRRDDVDIGLGML